MTPPLLKAIGCHALARRPPMVQVAEVEEALTELGLTCLLPPGHPLENSEGGLLYLEAALVERLLKNAGVTYTVEKGSLALRPVGKPKLIREPSTGLTITKGPAKGPKVTSKNVRSLLEDFP